MYAKHLPRHCPGNMPPSGRISGNDMTPAATVAYNTGNPRAGCKLWENINRLSAPGEGRRAAQVGYNPDKHDQHHQSNKK
ncbi:hypothetical protein GCM10023078_46660 [Gibbsiella greigii]